MAEKPGIYAIRHIESGKVYVGSASNISKRWSRHRKDLRMGIHKNKHLQAAWSKYGEEAFVFEILELTSELNAQEQFWIDSTGCLDPKNGYNCCPIARSSRGFKRGPESEEQRRRKSQYLKGQCGSGITSPVFKGVDHGQSKLTDEDVREIRHKYGPVDSSRRVKVRGRPSYSDLAREYGITISVICQIMRGNAWKHVK